MREIPERISYDVLIGPILVPGTSILYLCTMMTPTGDSRKRKAKLLRFSDHPSLEKCSLFKSNEVSIEREVALQQHGTHQENIQEEQTPPNPEGTRRLGGAR